MTKFQNLYDYYLKCSLTDVIVKCFVVKLLMDPVLINLENLLAAGILFPKRSSQNYFQLFGFIPEKEREYVCQLHVKHVKLCILCVCMCEGHESFLPVLEAVCSGQDPTGVNEYSSTSEKVFSVTGLININDRLPRLFRNVALSAPKHAEHRAIQGVV